jgi:hypothetical protein
MTETMHNKVRLTRHPDGSYRAHVTVINSGVEPFEIKVVHTGPAGPSRGLASLWVIDGDEHRSFPTLQRAREYLNTFFENAPKPSRGRGRYANRVAESPED